MLITLQVLVVFSKRCQVGDQRLLLMIKSNQHIVPIALKDSQLGATKIETKKPQISVLLSFLKIGLSAF